MRMTHTFTGSSFFGIAQQLVTRFADNQAAGLLEAIGGRGARGERSVKGQAP